MMATRGSRPKPKGAWKKWVAGAAAAATVAGIAERQTHIGEEMWRDYRAPSMRAPERGGSLEAALAKYARVHDFGPKGAKKTVYVIPQTHPQVDTLEAGEEAVRSQADIHFMLDELGRRGVRFVYGEGVPFTAAAEFQVGNATRPAGGKGWQKELERRTASGDVEGVRDFYRGTKPAVAYFVREKWKPADFRLVGFGEEFPYGVYLQNLYGEFSDAVGKGINPKTGELSPQGRRDAEEAARKIYLANRYRSYRAADILKNAADRGDTAGIMGDWHAKDIVERIKMKGHDKGDTRFRVLIPKSSALDLNAPPPMRSRYKDAYGKIGVIEHTEPTAEDKRKVDAEIRQMWERSRQSSMDSTGEDIGEWKSPVD